jgi:hypothetical protein
MKKWRDSPVSFSSGKQLASSLDDHIEESALRVVVIDFQNDERVIPFLSAHSSSLIYHHPAWLTALQEETGQQCFMLGCESDDGSLCGIMPLAYTRGLPFNIFNHQTKRRVSSLPRTPFVGPISLIPEATELLIAAALERAETEGIQLQIKSDSLLPLRDHDKLVCNEWRPTYVLALSESPDQLNLRDAKTRHNLKWGVNKARKLNLAVRTAETLLDLEAWYRLYLTTMRRNFVPPRSYKFFLSLWRGLNQSGSMRLLLAEQITGRRATLVAGSIFLMMGKTVSYAFTGCSTRHLSTHANDIILWHSISGACHDGYRFFDFGEVPEHCAELIRFKTKWGSLPKPLYRYYWPQPEQSAIRKKPHWLQSALRQTWQRVPLSITARVGEWLYGYL